MKQLLLSSPSDTGWTLPHLNYLSELYCLRVLIPTQRLTQSLCTLHPFRYLTGATLGTWRGSPPLTKAGLSPARIRQLRLAHIP